jgi:hypothetical protein
MDDWTQDPRILYAVKTYNTAYAAWLQVGVAGETARLDSPPKTVAIYLRLRAADRAYVYARDAAIAQATVNKLDDMFPKAVSGEGAGPPHEAKQAALTTIIETVNDKFGTNLAGADQLWVEQQVTAAIEDPHIRNSALANTENNFAYTFDRRFEGLVIDRHDANGEMLRRFLDQPEFADLFTAWARSETFRQVRKHAAGA